MYSLYIHNSDANDLTVQVFEFELNPAEGGPGKVLKKEEIIPSNKSLTVTADEDTNRIRITAKEHAHPLMIRLSNPNKGSLRLDYADPLDKSLQSQSISPNGTVDMGVDRKFGLKVSLFGVQSNAPDINEDPLQGG